MVHCFVASDGSLASKSPCNTTLTFSPVLSVFLLSIVFSLPHQSPNLSTHASTPISACPCILSVAPTSPCCLAYVPPPPSFTCHPLQIHFVGVPVSSRVSNKIQQLLNTLKRPKRPPLREFFVDDFEELLDGKLCLKELCPLITHKSLKCAPI